MEPTPRQSGPLEFLKTSVWNTVGLLLRTMKSYFDTGRYVILDSGFCFLKGVDSVEEEWVFFPALS